MMFDFDKMYPHFRLLRQPFQPRRATIAFLIVRVGCQKCFGVTGGAPQVIPALRAVWFADLRIVASQFKSPSRALIIA